MVDMILFPSSYYSIKKVDEDLQKEYDAVIETGLFETVFLGYDQWFNEEKLILNRIPEREHTAVYRGWMMQPEKYEKLFNLLLQKNIRLVTKPEEYNEMHVFPNVYDKIREDTARIELYPLHSKIDIENIKLRFDRFMVKDYVKSVKGTQFPAYFDSGVSQEYFDRYMEIFYQFRGDLLTGGICIKEYLDLMRYEDKTNEFRVFYINHEIATVCRNSGQGIFTKEPPQELIEKYKNLNSVYYTVDYAELADGNWKILETGDGSVSGLSEGQDHISYFRALYHCFN